MDSKERRRWFRLARSCSTRVSSSWFGQIACFSFISVSFRWTRANLPSAFCFRWCSISKWLSFSSFRNLFCEGGWGEGKVGEYPCFFVTLICILFRLGKNLAMSEKSVPKIYSVLKNFFVSSTAHFFVCLLLLLALLGALLFARLVPGGDGGCCIKLLFPQPLLRLKRITLVITLYFSSCNDGTPLLMSQTISCRVYLWDALITSSSSASSSSVEHMRLLLRREVLLRVATCCDERLPVSQLLQLESESSQTLVDSTEVNSQLYNSSKSYCVCCFADYVFERRAEGRRAYSISSCSKHLRGKLNRFSQ